jgi:hypothetical protein
MFLHIYCIEASASATGLQIQTIHIYSYAPKQLYNYMCTCTRLLSTTAGWFCANVVSDYTDVIIEHVLEDDVEGVVGVDLHLHGAKTKPGGSQNLFSLSSPRYLIGNCDIFMKRNISVINETK